MIAVILLVLLYLSYQSSPSVPPPKLPTYPQSFTGREVECDNILQYITKEKVKVVAITGGPGFGKSSLSIVAGYKLADLAKQVWHISLSDVDSIDSFILRVMATFTNKNLKIADKTQLYSWLLSVKYETVLILDNVDRLTLNDSTVRSEFQLLLKTMSTRTEKIQYIVTTRFRFRYTDDFEEVHLTPLVVDQGGQLLLKLSTSTSREAMVEEELSIIQDLESIANLTGGVPLAMKIVGRLLKSGQLSISEVHKELSVDPIGALSLESFSPDEQLNRCFNLSIQSLSKIGRKCFFTTSLFPGTFDKAAKDIVIKVTKDRHCIDQLLDRSLLEYNVQDKRFSMHSLLQEFAINSFKKGERAKLRREFFSAFSRHYMSKVNAYHKSSDYQAIYSCLISEYHNIVRFMTVYSDDHLDIQVKDILVFAETMFDIMQATLPGEVLLKFWLKVQDNTCKASYFEQLCVRYLRFAAKIGKLLYQYDKNSDSLIALELAMNCVYSERKIHLAEELLCVPPSEGGTELVFFLQVLKKVYKALKNEKMINQTRAQLYDVLDRTSNPSSFILEDFCSDGIEYLQYRWEKTKQFSSTEQLLRGLIHCDRTEEVDIMFSSLRHAYFSQEDQTELELWQYQRVIGSIKIASFCSNRDCEIDFLEKVITIAEKNDETQIMLYPVHLYLASLYYKNTEEMDKAYVHALAAYEKSVENIEKGKQCAAFKAAIWMGSILLKLNTKPGADEYFVKALRHLHVCPSADALVVLKYQQFIESQLLQYHFLNGKYIQCLQHYGQWAKLDLSNHFYQFLNTLDLSLRPRVATRRDLTVIDSSPNDLKRLLFQTVIISVLQQIDSFSREFDSSISWYLILADGFALFLFGLINIVVLSCCCCCCFVPMVTCSPLRVIFRIAIKVHFYFHCFLYHAILDHKLVFSTVSAVMYPPVLGHLHASISLFILFGIIPCFLLLYPFYHLIFSYKFPGKVYDLYSFPIFKYSIYKDFRVAF